MLTGQLRPPLPCLSHELYIRRNSHFSWSRDSQALRGGTHHQTHGICFSL